MPLELMQFQKEVCSGVVARFENVRLLYDSLREADPQMLDAARKRDGAVVMQAPTGAGKTLIAAEVLARLATRDRVLWFWFAPFAGLIEQARKVLAAQVPELTLFDTQNDRSVDTVRDGGVFVTTWASVATRRKSSRRARTTGDAGLALDALVQLAREEGMRIGCVVDEAHHGFHRSTEARRFFTEVLAPDYTLMMTATPRDSDVAAFADKTGWEVGEPADWASVSRIDAVDAGLLKRGVRMVRFLARDGDTAQLIDYEHLALRECADTHRNIQTLLDKAGVALTPLMLVQVPDGKKAQEDVRRHLIEQLGFSEQAVRVHTADEPDPDLLALADDPTVEVLIFKMAVALGFDAPRAFTLAALRGARDPSFGVQVIGRIVRVPHLLQGRRDLPPGLDHGYVFLANAESQEGLLDAGKQINQLTTHVPEVGTQTVLTHIGGEMVVQVARSGEPLSLLVSPDGTQVLEGSAPGEDALGPERPLPDAAQTAFGDAQDAWSHAAQDLLVLAGGEVPAAREGSELADLTAPLLLIPSAMYRYPRHGDAPDTLRGERLPPPPSDLEARVVDFVDFSTDVLGSRHRSRVQVRRDERGLFDQPGTSESGKDLWASLSPEAVAEKAGQLRMRLSEANDRVLHERLAERFSRAIEQSGAEPPADEETLLQQLDLVLVRHPRLLSDAYRRCRADMIVDVAVPLPAELHSDIRLQAAARALYGVLPPGLNEDELAVAKALDESPLVQWWHRNLPRREESVGLYRWDEGRGYYPDFVLALEGREKPDGVALLEVKGSHLWGTPTEVEKSGAEHPDYGEVFMAGRARGQRDFVYLRRLGAENRLESSGSFDVARMRW